MSELYSHLPSHTAAQLTGVAGAAQLREAGYSAAAVLEGAPAGAFSVWDLKLAGYQLPAGCSAEQAPAAGGAGSAGAGSLSPRTGRLSKQQQQSPQQQQQGQHTAGMRPADVQYFRHQIVPLMQMKAEQHVPPLLRVHHHTSPGTALTPRMAAAAGNMHMQQPPQPQASHSRLAARTASSITRAKASAEQRIKWQVLGADQAQAENRSGTRQQVVEASATAAPAGGEADVGVR